MRDQLKLTYASQPTRGFSKRILSQGNPLSAENLTIILGSTGLLISIYVAIISVYWGSKETAIDYTWTNQWMSVTPPIKTDFKKWVGEAINQFGEHLTEALAKTHQWAPQQEWMPIGAGDLPLH